MFFLLNDDFRKIKFTLSVALIFALSNYSYQAGLNEMSIYERVNGQTEELNSFPYLKVENINKNKITVKDKWGDLWVANWPSNIENPPLEMFVSFKGKMNYKKEIFQINSIIVHKGYKIKLYISIFALIILAIFFARIFSIDSNGLFRRKL